MILVTGALGTIGKRLTDSLDRLGKEWVGIDIRHCDNPKVYRCDIRNFRTLTEIFDSYKPNKVLHLAAEFGRENGEDYYDELWQTNAIGTRNVLELCVNHSSELIFASSSEVYGNLPHPQKEEDTQNQVISFNNDYAISKWVNEIQIQRYIQKFGLKAVILRLFNAYGPGEYYTPYRSVVCKFIHCIKRHIPIVGYRNYHRVFMYIDDLIMTLVTVLDVKIPSGKIINIGGTEYKNIEQLIEIIEQSIKIKANVQWKDIEQFNVVNKQPDISKAKMYFNHNPNTTLSIGIPLTVSWMP